MSLTLISQQIMSEFIYLVVIKFRISVLTVRLIKGRGDLNSLGYSRIFALL